MFWLALFWALLAWNLYHPWKGKPEVGGVISFAFGLLVGELALHVIALQVLITLLVVASCGLSGFADALGLAIAFASWLAMALFFYRSHNAADEMEAGIRQALGQDYANDIAGDRRDCLQRKIDYRKLINPFAFSKPEVLRHRNIRYYEGEEARLHLDIFHHRDKPQNAPVLLQIHGGAWLQNLGNKDQQALPLMNELASRGWVCVTVQYRLSPAVAMPVHIIDCKRALCWVKEHIAEYGGDPNFIIVTGGSAGGHLSAMVALSANNPAFQPGFENADTRVQGAVPFYGVHDFTNSQQQRPHFGLENFIASRVMKVTRYDNPQLWENCSPLFNVSDQAPPTLLIHGEADTLASVNESRALLAALQEQPGVEAGLAELSDAQHAFELMYSLRTLHVIDGVERFGNALHGRYLQRGKAQADARD